MSSVIQVIPIPWFWRVRAECTGFPSVTNARLSPGHIFHKVAPGYTDGFRCDADGRIWSSAADGVHCIDPDGTLLGRIRVPFTVSNLEFGGRNRSHRFICASHTIYAVYTNTRGAWRLPGADQA